MPFYPWECKVVLHNKCASVRMLYLISHADDSGGSEALWRCLWFCLCVCLSVCPHVKTKTAETEITNLGTGIRVHAYWLIKARSQGHRVQKDDRVYGVSYALYRLPSRYRPIVCALKHYCYCGTEVEWDELLTVTDGRLGCCCCCWLSCGRSARDFLRRRRVMRFSLICGRLRIGLWSQQNKVDRRRIK